MTKLRSFVINDNNRFISTTNTTFQANGFLSIVLHTTLSVATTAIHYVSCNTPLQSRHCLNIIAFSHLSTITLNINSSIPDRKVSPANKVKAHPASGTVVWNSLTVPCNSSPADRTVPWIINMKTVRAMNTFHLRILLKLFMVFYSWGDQTSGIIQIYITLCLSFIQNLQIMTIYLCNF